MLGLFKQAKAAPSPTDTLKRLREVLDTLEKRENFLGTRVNAERDKAKKLATSNKKGTFHVFVMITWSMEVFHRRKLRITERFSTQRENKQQTKKKKREKKKRKVADLLFV
jgi:hypothetical protein